MEVPANENKPAMQVAPIHDPGASTVSKIDTYEHKGKKVIRLAAPNGLEVEVVPAMSNKGPMFFIYVDKNLSKPDNGNEFFDLEGASKKISEFGTHGVSLEDLGKLTTQLEVLAHNMRSKAKKPVAQTNQNGFALEETAGFEFFEDDATITQVNESVNESFKDDNSNVPIPDKDTTMEEKEEVEPVVEGQYLQSGLSTREAPIPFTQDPECKGVPDYLNDEEKAGLLPQNTGANNGVDGGGEAMSESILDQFKKGDAVCIDRVMDVEWLVESISMNPDKMVVKNGKRTKVISPATTFIEHADGANIHKERQLESLDALKEAYMKMTFEEDPRALKANWCTYEEGVTQEKTDSKLPILEKNDMYSFIKSNDLHKTDEVAAFQAICEKYSNPIEEIEKVMEDVKSSEANEKVDEMYNFDATPFEENAIGLATTLEAAWQEMEKKEMEETAKLSDEQPGANGGGLGPKQIKFNL
jgi:hypothetical protein